MSLKNWFGSLSNWKKLGALNAKEETSLRKSEEKMSASGSMAKAFTGGIIGTLETLATKADPLLEIEYDSVGCRYIAKARWSGVELGYLDSNALHIAPNPQHVIDEFLAKSVRSLKSLKTSMPARARTTPAVHSFSLPIGKGGMKFSAPEGDEEWAFIRRSGDGYLVQTWNGSFETKNFFDAMLYVSNFYGVDLDEDSDSKK